MSCLTRVCAPATLPTKSKRTGDTAMIHFVLHETRDNVAVVVVEGVKAGMELNGWIMDEDKTTNIVAKQDIPIGHKVVLVFLFVGVLVFLFLSFFFFCCC